MAIPNHRQIRLIGITTQLKATLIPTLDQMVLGQEIIPQKLVIMVVVDQSIQALKVVSITSMIMEEKSMFQNSKWGSLIFVIAVYSINASAQNGKGNLGSMTGAMQGWMQGSKEANDREQQTYQINMRTYQLNLEDYYRCLDYQLRFKKEGIDVDMKCKKPTEPER